MNKDIYTDKPCLQGQAKDDFIATWLLLCNDIKKGATRRGIDLSKIRIREVQK